MIYFTSDTHFLHKNILKYSNRPFASVEEMNEALIEKWNAVVEPGDTIYHLGDFGLGNVNKLREIMNRLNGNKRYIIGNHDSGDLLKKIGESCEWMKDYYRLRIPEHSASSTASDYTYIIMSHYPIASWDMMAHGAIHLHGHTHNSYKANGKILDVGVDNPFSNFTPVSLDRVLEYMKDKVPEKVDHHF